MPKTGPVGDITPTNRRRPYLQGSTSDAIRNGGKGRKARGGDPARAVKLKVEIPKNLRKAVRSEAEAQGVSVDVIVTSALRQWFKG